MRKFTIFTVILSIIVVVVVAEVVATEYLPSFRKKIDNFEISNISMPSDLDLSKVIETNTLGSDVDYSKITEDQMPGGIEELEIQEVNLSDSELGAGFGSDFDTEFSSSFSDIAAGSKAQVLIDDSNVALPVYESSNSGVSDFEDSNYTALSPTAYIRDDMIKSAGFATGYLEQEPHNGFLFKTIYIDDLQDVEMTKYLIRTKDSYLAKVYVFNIGPLSGVNEVFEVLKVRGSEGLDVEVNGTNNFGDESFYLNDSRRTGVAFLTVRFGSIIYGFSYPKNYHPQISNLIKLIDMEF